MYFIGDKDIYIVEKLLRDGIQLFCKSDIENMFYND